MIEEGVLLFTCVMALNASAELSLDPTPPVIAEESVPMSLQYIVRNEGADVTMIGNNGAVGVSPIWDEGVDIVTFVEVTPAGSPMIMTIDYSSKEPPFPAVYSRHTKLGAAFIVSQYYGDCIIQ